MNRTAFNIAASTMIVAMTMVACASQSDAMRRFASPAAGADRTAAQLHDQAARALQQGQLAEALAAMEEAVAAEPRDAGYRLLLADIYMRSGRFESAAATYADVIELDPGNVRAALGFALMQIARGRPQSAVAQLDHIAGRVAPSDVGLAYALAGVPERAIEILEPAARGYDATPRLRQNLALSYALAGNWQRARAVAAQDISPAELGARMQQWATLARPDATDTRVASLLGVTPVHDAGQPVRLALAPNVPEPIAAYAETAPISIPGNMRVEPPAPIVAGPADIIAPPAPVYAEVAPAPVSDWGLPTAPAAAPVQIAEAPAPPIEAPSYYLPPPPAAEQPASGDEVRYAAAARTLIQPSPAVVRTASVSLPSAPAFRRPAAQAGETPVRAGNSRFVVQLGAFSNEGNAERAWQQAERRFGLQSRQPLTTTFDHQGRTLHRVSVAGFASQSDAQRLCSSIKSRGGACFVRANAGDAVVRWAARYGPARTRNA